jgi:hypothetical protein
MLRERSGLITHPQKTVSLTSPAFLHRIWLPACSGVSRFMHPRAGFFKIYYSEYSIELAWNESNLRLPHQVTGPGQPVNLKDGFYSQIEVED